MKTAYKNYRTFICYHAGCGIYEIEPYLKGIEWHNDSDVFKGTLEECWDEQGRPKNLPHYPNAKYESIFDY